MYSPPEGLDPTPDQVRELDDTYLASDPYGYFISRVGMLHAWARQDTCDDSVLAGDAVGRPDLAATIAAVMSNKDASTAPTTMVVSSQVALDAFTLRHHVAEALVRLFVAFSRRAIEPSPESLWANATDDKQQIYELLDAARSLGNGDLPGDEFARMVLPPGYVVDADNLEAVDTFVTMCWNWTEHAVKVLAPAELDLTTAHNKVKHGLVVRGRADLRTALSVVAPNADADLSITAFDPSNSVDLLRLPSIEFLSRPRLRHRPYQERQGLEVTQMALDYRAMLAEVAVLAHVHGSLFHVAAHAHFAAHDPTATVAPHPGVVAEAPPVGFAGPPVGTRYPVTEPDGVNGSRPGMFCFPDGTQMTFRITGPRMSGRIVDDRAGVEPAPHRDDETGAEIEGRAVESDFHE